MEIKISVPVNPTEDKAKVLRAVENVFPSLDFEGAGDALIGKGSEEGDLAVLKEHLKQQHIRATAMGFLRSKSKPGKLEFEINKQAAFVGRLNFVDFPVALGTINIEIKDKDIEKLIERLCG